MAALVAVHQIAKHGQPEGYPPRQKIRDDQVSWQVPVNDYHPPYYVSPVVLDQDCTKVHNGWADPEDPTQLKKIANRTHQAIEICFDDLSRPLNPMGRRGLAGRGLLGRWGANFAADPIVTRYNPQSGQLEVLLITRRDCGQLALPGGMVDPDDETPTGTAIRELFEETGVQLREKGKVLLQGYVDDPRNTDHAWMETTVVHFHLSADQAQICKPKAGDDATSVHWVPLTPNMQLYASHAKFVDLVWQDMHPRPE